MRVAIDEQILLLQRRGGVSRYFVELLRAFRGGALGVDAVLPTRRVWNEHALELLDGLGLQPIPQVLAPYPELLRAAARPRRSPTGVDLVHHSFYNRRFLRDFPGRPKVVTIYDMIPEVTGQRGRFGNPHMAKREYVKRADLLIYISESARQDLVEAYGEPQVPWRVTHLGVDQSFFAAGPPPADFPRDYVLFVGKREGYKDFPVMLKAFAELRTDHPDLHLVCVGGGPFQPEEASAIAAAGLSGLVEQHQLPDAQMPGAYAGARAFAFPSRYEGFGLPVLEAMAAGTPAILARTSSLPEVGGEAARYFPAGDAGELAATVHVVLGDEQTRQSMVALGKARAAGFTWQATAAATAAAYRSLVPDGH